MSCMSPYSMPLWTILTKWPAPFGPDPIAAGGAVGDLGGDRLEDRLDVRPGVGVAAGHDRGPLERSFLAAGDARADEQEPFCLECRECAGSCRESGCCRRR